MPEHAFPGPQLHICHWHKLPVTSHAATCGASLPFLFFHVSCICVSPSHFSGDMGRTLRYASRHQHPPLALLLAAALALATRGGTASAKGQGFQARLGASVLAVCGRPEAGS